jgi:SUF system NifU family Fe-S assembly protein
MSDMADLYQAVIIEHDRSPRNFRVLPEATHRAAGRNPLCGDEVSVELAVNAEGRITDVAFQGRGCAISRASASLMTTALKGKTTAEARELFDQFHALLTNGTADRAALGKLAVLAGVAAYPMRVKCATMAWHTMKEALGDGPEPRALSPDAER